MFKFCDDDFVIAMRYTKNLKDYKILTGATMICQGKIKTIRFLLFNDPKRLLRSIQKNVNCFFYLFLQRSNSAIKFPLIIALKIFRSMPFHIRNSIRYGFFYIGGESILFRHFGRNNTRRYLKASMTLETFFEKMNRRGCNYVVLRWWQNLPEVSPGEDIDILIMDEDRDIIDDLLVVQQVGQAVDLYTVNGTNGGAYHDTTYFPPRFANSILKSRQLYKNKYYIPDKEHYFLSLAYHAVFHKGKNSHIPGFTNAPEMKPEHEYKEVLERLSLDLGFANVIDVNTIIEGLGERDFLPSPDALTMLEKVQPSLADLQPALYCDIRGGELNIFVVRKECMNDGYIEILKDIILSNYRFDILSEFELTGEQARYLEFNMRGGNWGKGPYKRSGGSPDYLIVAFDFFPEPLSNKLQSMYPRFTNLRFLECKNEIRQQVNCLTGFNKAYNPAHTTDNESESLWFLRRILDQDSYASLLANLIAIRDHWVTKYPVLELISKGRRSKVELVEYEGRPAIKKTFKNWATRFLEREIYAAGILQQTIPAIPKLLASGDNYLITEYHKPKFSTKNPKNFKTEVQKHSSSLKLFINNLWKHGYAHMNLLPTNIIITDNRLYIIDFEFLHKYNNQKPSFCESYDLVGAPSDFNGDLPVGYNSKLNSFDAQWGCVFGSYRKFFGEQAQLN